VILLEREERVVLKDKIENFCLYIFIAVGIILGLELFALTFIVMLAEIVEVLNTDMCYWAQYN